MTTTTPFEDEVHRIAVSEGMPVPQVTFREGVRGTAATAPSGRHIAVDNRVLGWTGPAQRWLAAHEMWHAIAHGWRAPQRWAPFCFSVFYAVVLAACGWVFRGSAVIGIVPGAALLGWLATVSWWNRRLEADADRYASLAGYRDALHEADLLEFLTSDADVPLWRSSHRRWADRLEVGPDALPEPMMQLRAQVDAIGAELAAIARAGWQRPYRLLVVQRLPKGRLAVGRWPGMIIATRDALLATPIHLRHSHLRVAVVASHRLPQLRACLAALLGAVGFAATLAYAAGLNTYRTGVVAAGCAVTLLFVAAYEAWRRINDRNLSNKQVVTRSVGVDDQPS